jgi:hypothetical protein
LLRRWLRARTPRNKKGSSALFVGLNGERLDQHGMDMVIHGHAERLGLHNPESDNLEAIANRESMDTYVHISQDQLREAFLASIPQFFNNLFFLINFLNFFSK